ncbi:GNAT family N-acetyltransferase [bacterium]|nr:GNAT family N-acetyltransferase [bacterium]
MSEIKKLSANNFDELINILSGAYPGIGISTPEQKEKFREKLIKIQNEDLTTQYFGLFRNKKMLGVMRIHDYTMNVFSQKIEVAGIGSVAVDLVHKKEKVCKEMLFWFLENCRQNDKKIAILYPFRLNFYEKMGFGYGTKMNQYKIKPAAFPNTSKKNIEFASSEDKEKVEKCYAKFASENHGMIERTPFNFQRVFGNPESKIVVCRDGNEVSGYIIFSFKSQSTDSFLLNNLVIHEFVYTTREAFGELCTFLHSQADQVHRVVLNTQDENFHYLLSDASNGTNNLLPHVFHESNVSGIGFAYKIVDARGIFETFKNHNFNDQTFRLKITIKDSFTPENAGSFVIHFKNGFASFGKQDFEAEIILDVSHFSSLFVGAVNFNSLYSFNLAEISDFAFVSKVNKIFQVAKKPVCFTAF